MNVKYAKDQPAGFTNRIERVAIVSGQVGQHLTEALLQTGKHIITAITREDSHNKPLEGVKIAKVNYDDESTLVEALKGQQFLIISKNVMAAPDSQDKLLAAAGKAGVPWVMPNGYSSDFMNEKLAQENFVGSRITAGTKAAEAAGLSWIIMCCSFWYEYSLALPGAYGLDMRNRKAVFYGDGNSTVNTSTWQQCGRAIAALLSLKELPEDEHDTAPTLSQWCNKPLYISSFLASQRDILDSVHRMMGTTDADWEITNEPHEVRYKRGTEMLQKGIREGLGLVLYTRVFWPNGDGNFDAKRGLANKVLGLPKEDMDQATERAIQMAINDWNPMMRDNAKVYN
ncbi:hypothetical protein ACHAQJ_001668 [Trichoderma viride]